MTYNLSIFAILATWYRRGLLDDYPTLNAVMAATVSVGGSYVVWKLGLYTIFKLYPEGNGAGFNLYWRGWRIVGLDWHEWLVRQDLATGKPLQPADHYLLNRPHIDLPLLELHHWPWIQFLNSVEVEKRTNEKNLRRAATAERKAERKARRAALVAQRGATSAPPTPLPGILNEEEEAAADSDILSMPPTPIDDHHLAHKQADTSSLDHKNAEDLALDGFAFPAEEETEFEKVIEPQPSS